jgi:hypothetical protein
MSAFFFIEESSANQKQNGFFGRNTGLFWILCFFALISTAKNMESSSMTFEKIVKGCPEGCICIDEKCLNNNVDVFCRRYERSEKSKKTKPKPSDFFSYVEEGKRAPSNCEFHCRYKGVSIQKWFDDESLIENYKITLSLRPIGIAAKNFYCRFKLKKSAGKVKHTPGHYDPQHHTFYKRDKFVLKDLDILNIEEFHV